jgi:restriction endonuclease Mrr
VTPPPPPWLQDIAVGELANLCLRLLERMGYTLLSQELDGSVAEIRGVDPQPIRGSRILVRAFAGPHPVEEPEVQATLDAIHQENITKALLVSMGGFSGEAESRAASSPLELIDGRGFEELVGRHLPEALDQTPGSPPAGVRPPPSSSDVHIPGA